jgi:hypothetical protein
MLSRQNNTSAWRLKLGLLSTVVLLMMTLPALNACAEKPQTENDPVAELVRLRDANAFLLDYADELTVELDACEKLLEIQESPPCDDGFPWVEIVVSVAVGVAVGAVLD